MRAASCSFRLHHLVGLRLRRSLRPSLVQPVEDDFPALLESPPLTAAPNFARHDRHLLVGDAAGGDGDVVR